VAVKNLSVCFESNECFGLLGPNGAGKTTTVSILSSTLDADAGYVAIDGQDVEADRFAAKQKIGVCPQFDLVAAELTVEDHLGFYGRIKGIDPAQLAGRVRQAAADVGLDGDSFRTPAGQLSGGQRRRLSIAVSMIGDPAVLFMDEPTTGMDPETRHAIWGIIEKAKRDRCIILTTHSMEEADALCTRIGIMAHGELVCVGPQLHLKSRFGDGLRLKLALNEDGEDAAEKIIRQVCADATLVFEFGWIRTYMLPKEGIVLSHAFDLLESAREVGQIKDFSLNQTSLEEVFIKLVSEAEGAEAANE